jgi:hypothetical protein
MVSIGRCGWSSCPQLSPDGRSVPRYLLGLARVRVAGRRRMGRALPDAGRRRTLAMAVATRGDAHRPVLSRARITGPCRVAFADPVLVRRSRRGRRAVPVAGEPRRLGVMVDVLELERDERLEVRP